MKQLTTQRLIIRNWKEKDKPIFHRLCSDEKIMRFFPDRNTRSQSDQLIGHVQQEIEEKKYGFAALELRETGEVIGLAGLLDYENSEIYNEKMVEIGWRLLPEFWGMGYASEAATKWLEYGFETLDFSEIVTFAVWNNEASLAVMRRINMTPDTARFHDNPNVPDTHPQLKHHHFYAITKDQWLNKKDGP